MRLSLQNIVNLHENMPCVIIGGSPNFKNFDYQSFRGIKIATGSVAIRLNNICKFDYWVNSNNEFPIPEVPFHLEIINSFKDYTFVLSDTAAYNSLWKKDKKFLEDNILPNWLTFDERHFHKEQCVKKKNCCNILNENLINDQYKTIQEFVAELYGSSEFPKQGGTVAEYGLALALILGCNPIYIQGVDLPLSKSDYIAYHETGDAFANEVFTKTKKYISRKYFIYYITKFKFYPYYLSIKNKFKNLISRNSIFFEDYDKIMSNFQILSNIAKIKNKNIFILSQISNLNKIEGFSYYDYRKINNETQNRYSSRKALKITQK